MMLVAPLGAASTAQANRFICGNFVWNAVHHDEATQPFPQPSDFKGGPVDNLELKSCEIKSLC